MRLDHLDCRPRGDSTDSSGSDCGERCRWRRSRRPGCSVRSGTSSASDAAHRGVDHETSEEPPRGHDGIGGGARGFDAQLEPMRPEPGHDTTTVAAIGSPFRSGHIAWRGFDPSISEAWDARTCVRSSRHVRRWPRGPTGWMREAVLLSHEFELDVIDGTPEPVLTGLIRLHDRMSSLAGVSPGVTVGRIVAAADVRARGAPPQVNPGPTVAQAVDAPRPARVLRRDRIQVRADVGHRYAYPTSRPRLPPGKAWSPTPAWLRGHTMSKVRPLDRPVCRPTRSRVLGSRPSIRSHARRASTRWPTSAAAREPVPP